MKRHYTLFTTYKETVQSFGIAIVIASVDFDTVVGIGSSDTNIYLYTYNNYLEWHSTMSLKI